MPESNISPRTRQMDRLTSILLVVVTALLISCGAGGAPSPSWESETAAHLAWCDKSGIPSVGCVCVAEQSQQLLLLPEFVAFRQILMGNEPDAPYDLTAAGEFSHILMLCYPDIDPLDVDGY